MEQSSPLPNTEVVEVGAYTVMKKSAKWHQKRCQFVVQKMTPSKVPNGTPKFGCRYGTFSLAPRRHAMNAEASIPVRCRSTSQ